MKRRQYLIGFVSLAVAFFVFVVPFIFIFLIASKSASEASRMAFSLPTNWHFVQNLIDVIQARNYVLLLAYFNSTVITVGGDRETFDFDDPENYLRVDDDVWLFRLES